MKTTKKTLAREYSFKFLYHLQLKNFEVAKKEITDSQNKDISINELLEEFDRTYIEKDGEHPDNIVDSEIHSFSRPIIKGILENEIALKETLSPMLTKGGIDDLTTIHKVILFIGAFELQYHKGVPAGVVINEAVNMAKKFGTKDSYSLVNGILDKLSKKL